MLIKAHWARVFQIFIFTLFTGTLFSALILVILIQGYGLFESFFAGIIVTGILSSPNLLTLHFGIQWIYKNSDSLYDRNRYFYFLWISLFSLPLILIISLVSGEITQVKISSIPPKAFLIPVPYIISALYFLFSINNKYDKKYPPHFSLQNLDILDADLEQ